MASFSVVNASARSPDEGAAGTVAARAGAGVVGPASDRRGRVVCVGHATLDAVYQIKALPARPTKVKAGGYGQAVGGMSANAACAIAALGGSVSLRGPIGDDEIGERIVAALARAGVRTGTIQVVPGARSSHSAIIVEACGERLIISHHGDALAARPDGGSLAPIDADVMLVDVRWPAGALPLARIARAAGVPVVLDGEMGNPQALAELVPLADHVIFSEPGFAEWLVGRSPNEVLDVSARFGEEALTDLVEAGARLAAITRGEQGVVWACRDGSGPVRSGHLPAFAVDAVETLGAGDAFHGAYALGLAEGRPVLDALRFAAAAAALRCTRRAADGNLPTRGEVLALLGD